MIATKDILTPGRILLMADKGPAEATESLTDLLVHNTDMEAE